MISFVRHKIKVNSMFLLDLVRLKLAPTCGFGYVQFTVHIKTFNEDVLRKIMGDTGGKNLQ